MSVLELAVFLGKILHVAVFGSLTVIFLITWQRPDRNRLTKAIYRFYEPRGSLGLPFSGRARILLLGVVLFSVTLLTVWFGLMSE